MSAQERLDVRPWSARKPQNVLLSAAFVVIAVALVWQALTAINEGRGGFVPYLMLLGGPVLAGYYIWYLAIRRFEDDGAN